MGKPDMFVMLLQTAHMCYLAAVPAHRFPVLLACFYEPKQR